MKDGGSSKLVSMQLVCFEATQVHLPTNIKSVSDEQTDERME